MSKLFIFAIGGTGSRVVKSLTFLLASGVDIKSTEIIPIIVDPDRANGDMNRTVEILNNYQRIRKPIESFEHCSFFKTPIKTLAEITATKDGEPTIGEGFHFELEGVQNERFRDFIDFSTLDESNKYLASLLFSDDNLNSDMDIGFKGNPNIGSVVLNQFKDSKEFKCFASNFQKDDRIFIISSIFGGTGAAGFPLILKNIRNAGPELSNHDFLRNAIIGAITILPYFGVSPADELHSKIDKNTFISKAKAALSYYSRNVSGNNSLNALYYIGDSETKDYANAEGAEGQQNDAHFVELAAALSIIDFAGTDESELVLANGKAIAPKYKEFGIGSNRDPISFNDMGYRTKDIIQKPLTQYFFFDLYLKRNIPGVLEKQAWTNSRGVKIDKHFIQQNFYGNYLKNFNKRFYEWLNEMARNKISFLPFSLDNTNSNIFDMVTEITSKSRMLEFKKNFALYNDALNDAETKIGSKKSEEKFLSIFSKATEKIVSQKY